MRAQLLQLLRCSRAAEAMEWSAGGRGLAPSPTARIIPRALFFGRAMYVVHYAMDSVFPENLPLYLTRQAR